VLEVDQHDGSLGDPRGRQWRNREPQRFRTPFDDAALAGLLLHQDEGLPARDLAQPVQMLERDSGSIEGGDGSLARFVIAHDSGEGAGRT
jgi:hypothetical protein